MAVDRYDTRSLPGAHRPMAPHRARETTVGNIIFAALLAYVAVEYVRPQDVFPILGVVRPALTLAALLSLFWFWRWGIRELVGDRLLVWYGLMTVMAGLWVPFAVNNFWAFQASKSLVMLWVASSVPLGLMLVDRARRDQFFFAWTLIGIYLAFYAMTHGGRGPGGFVEDQNDLALVQCMVLTFPYFYAQQRELPLPKRVFHLGAALIILIGILSTQSRGGFVGLVCVGAYMFWLSQNKIRNLLVIGVLAVGALQFAPDTYIERMQTITNTEDGSRNERLLSWRIGWNMFLDSPIVGVGPQNFPYHAGRIQTRMPDYRVGDKVLAGRAAHSLWFTLLPEFGIIGSVLFFSIIIGIMRRLKACDRALAPAIAAGDAAAERDLLTARAIRASVIAYITAGTFLSVLYHPHVAYFIGFVLALSRSVELTTKAVAAKAQPDGTTAGARSVVPRG